MKRILLPTDFSENALNAIYHGLHLYGDEPVTFFLFHSWYTPLTSPHASETAIATAKEETIVAFDRLIKQAKRNFEKHDLKFEKIFRYGPLADMVDEIVEEHELELIIMGTQGASGLEEVLIGSSTAELIKKVHCPVLAIPEKSNYRKPQKIVFAVDAQHEPLGIAIGPMVEIAQKFNAEILMLHVNGKNTDYDSSEVESYMKGVRFTYHTVDDNNTLHGLEAFVKEHEADILSMVTHDLTFFEKLFHRSLTRRMIMHTKVPLLTMHAK